MFDTFRMFVCKFNEQKRHLKQNLRQLFYRHDYVRKKNKTILSFSSKYHLKCSKCEKRSFIEPWLDYRGEET